MLINNNALDLVFKGFKSVYTDAYDKAPANALDVAMQVPSASREETYGWLGQFPQLREWIGARVVHGLEAHSFSILNKKFESTIRVKREDIADDKIGVFKPVLSEMGWLARQHPEEMVFGLLESGFEAPCFDGQNYFDTDHPLTNKKGEPITVSNMQAGTDPAWYLLDTSRMVRPIVWQIREDYEFQRMDRSEDPHVFLNDEYLYGIRARVNAGFGLWQLAYASKAPLTPANYAAARAAMMSYRSDGGRVLGVMPNKLVVPPTLESAALSVLNTELTDTGGSNPWKNTADLIVTPFLEAA